MGDGISPWTRLLVGHERHRSDFAGPVATLAVVLQDGKNVFVERWRAGFVRFEAWARLQGGRNEDQTDNPEENASCLHDRRNSKVRAQD